MCNIGNRTYTPVAENILLIQIEKLLNEVMINGFKPKKILACESYLFYQKLNNFNRIPIEYINHKDKGIVMIETL